MMLIKNGYSESYLGTFQILMVFGSRYGGLHTRLTDTLRRSLSVELVDWLLERGAQVQVYDPAVKELPISWANRVEKCASAHENLEEIQALVVGTEWPEFKDEARRLPEFAKSNLLIIDANRHLLDSLRETAMPYLSVGSRQAN